MTFAEYYYSHQNDGDTCVACSANRRDEKPDGKRQLGRPRYRWDDNIKVVSSVNMVSGSEMN
jgi:hypothetical protein